MSSSTSHSDRWIPGWTVLLLLMALVAWAGCIFYSLRLNPEVRHYSQGAAIKNAWAEKMTREHGHKILVFGGSSVEFSIDGERMLNKHQLPVVNYGRHAGMGAMVLTESVLEHLAPGDTLIVSLEPGLLTVPLEQTSLGVQFSFAQRRPNWVLHPVLGLGRLNWFQAAALLRPGGYHTFTMLGKLARGKSLYRYQLSDYRASGWKQTAVRVNLEGPAEHSGRLSADSRALLQALRAWCDRHQVRGAYALSWSYSPAAQEHSFQQENLRFLEQVAEYLPILKDARLGADPILEHFSDSALHPNEAGAAVHTDELAGQIKQWEFWTTEELRSLQTAD